jgi:hypothetical protein
LIIEFQFLIVVGHFCFPLHQLVKELLEQFLAQERQLYLLGFSSFPTTALRNAFMRPWAQGSLDCFCTA